MAIKALFLGSRGIPHLLKCGFLDSSDANKKDVETTPNRISLIHRKIPISFNHPNNIPLNTTNIFFYNSLE